MTRLFDYERLARQLSIPPELLEQLEQIVRRQYGSDEMLAELRLVRTLRAVEHGRLTVADAIKEFREAEEQEEGNIRRAS